MKIGILYSGGLDSKIMYEMAKRKFPHAEIVCVWYNIGQGYNYKEQSVLPDFVKIRQVDWLSDDYVPESKEGSNSGNIIIPGRNMVLATLMATQELPDEIWMGALLGETHEQSTDKNYTFLEKINDTLSYVLSPFKKNIKVRFPLADSGFGKLEAVQYALSVGVPAKELLTTSSCLSSEKGNCGKCVVCARRWGIFTQLGLDEKYNVHPTKVKENLEMFITIVDGEITGDCHYDEFRRREIVPTLISHYKPKDLVDLKQILEKELEWL